MSLRSSILATFLVVATSTISHSTEQQVVCSIEGCREVAIPEPSLGSVSAFSAQQIWLVVNQILSVSGLSPNFEVMETNEVTNAAAVILKNERYLAFNPSWLKQYSSSPDANWWLLGIIAHEVGHHLQGHTLSGIGSRPATELEADEYAGFVLAALGASLEEAQSLWRTLPPEGSPTHPPRHQRLLAVERGWLKHGGRQRNQPTTQCFELSASEGWQQLPKFPPDTRLTVSGDSGWSVDRNNYKPVGFEGHTGRDAEKLNPYNAYKYDERFPFGALLIRRDGGAVSVIENVPTPLHSENGGASIELRINDRDDALADNGGSLRICVEHT